METSHFKPDKAFILAAGTGSRLRPYTDHCPKPMVAVGGRSLIAHSLDKLEQSGVKDVVVNLHYKADMLENHLAGCRSPAIHFSYEKDLLDTGGGIKKALAHFDGQPFFVLSGDAFWEDRDETNALASLSAAWEPEKMDILMLLQPVRTMRLTRGVGDYDLAETGRAVRSLDQTGAFMFTSLRLNHPRIFDGAPQGAFSYLDLMDRAQKAGRLYGLVYEGAWHHISTPEDLDSVRASFEQEPDQEKRPA